MAILVFLAFLMTYGGVVLIGGGLLLVLIVTEVVDAVRRGVVTEGAPLIEHGDPTG